jgi:hypothetical protein
LVRPAHPVSDFPQSVIEEIAYRVYLLGLDPQMTPEQSAATHYETRDNRNRVMVQDDASRRRSAAALIGRTRAYLRVLIDMRLLDAPGKFSLFD